MAWAPRLLVEEDSSGVVLTADAMLAFVVPLAVRPSTPEPCRLVLLLAIPTEPPLTPLLLGRPAVCAPENATEEGGASELALSTLECCEERERTETEGRHQYKKPYQTTNYH